MKKVLAVVLMTTVALSLFACAKKQASTTETQAQTKQEESSVTMVESKPDNLAETQAAQEPLAIVPSTLIHPITEEHCQIAQQPNNQYVYEVSWPAIRLDGAESTTYASLQTSFNALNEELKNKTVNNMKMFQEDYQMAVKDNIPFDHSRLDTNVMSLYRSDSNYVSVIVTQEWDGGGAHGNHIYSVYNYDVATGKKLILGDIVKDRDKFVEAVKTLLKKNYANVEFFDLEGNLKTYVLDDNTTDPNQWKFNWALGYDGITVIFNQDELAPYAAGYQIIKLNYVDYQDLFIDLGKVSSTPSEYVYVKDTQWDANGYRTQPYTVVAAKKTFTFNFKELDDDEAIVDILGEDGSSVGQLKGRLVQTYDKEDVTEKVEGINQSQTNVWMKAFVDPNNFDLEYLDKATGKVVTNNYSIAAYAQ